MERQSERFKGVNMLIDFILNNILPISLLVIEVIFLIAITIICYIHKQIKLFKICLTVLFIEAIVIVYFICKISSLNL